MNTRRKSDRKPVYRWWGKQRYRKVKSMTYDANDSTVRVYVGRATSYRLHTYFMGRRGLTRDELKHVVGVDPLLIEFVNDSIMTTPRWLHRLLKRAVKRPAFFDRNYNHRHR